MTKASEPGRSVRSASADLRETSSTRRVRPQSEGEAPVDPSVNDAALKAGMRDDAVRAKTGRTWAEWVQVLDSMDAAAMPHREIAAHLHRAFELPGWWAQTVTVGYERIRGLRDVGQRRGGSYEVNKTRTFAAPVATLYRAFSLGRTRRRWLAGPDIAVRTATPDRTLRFTSPDGSAGDISFQSKGAGRSSVTIQHRKLATKDAAELTRAIWAERLGALGRLLE